MCVGRSAGTDLRFAPVVDPQEVVHNVQLTVNGLEVNVLDSEDEAQDHAKGIEQTQRSYGARLWHVPGPHR